MAWIWERH